MLSFNNENTNISKSTLLISEGAIGFSCILASKILIAKNGFSKVGTYFSEYITSVITRLPDGELRNGDTYFSKEHNITIILFTGSVPNYYGKVFYKELNDFIASYSFKETIIMSGFISQYQSDQELSNIYVEPVYLTNIKDIEDKLKKSGFRSFVDLCDIKSFKKTKTIKELSELDYMPGIGFTKHFLRYQKKNKLNYTYIGTYIRQIFDIEAAISLLIGILSYLGLDYSFLLFHSQEEGNTKILVKKNEINKNLSDLEKYGIGNDWLNFTKTN